MRSRIMRDTKVDIAIIVPAVHQRVDLEDDLLFVNHFPLRKAIIPLRRRVFTESEKRTRKLKKTIPDNRNYIDEAIEVSYEFLKIVESRKRFHRKNLREKKMLE